MDNLRLRISPRRNRHGSKNLPLDICNFLRILLNSFFTPFAIFCSQIKIIHRIIFKPQPKIIKIGGIGAKKMKKTEKELMKTMNPNQKEAIENNIISEKVINLLKEKNNIK